MKHLNIVDMFCGGGGESCGLYQAAEEQGYKVHLTAINHWERAIETHSANFPHAAHFCESIEHLDPTKVIKNQHIDLLWASPECTHHSNARGGRPKSNQSRATAWMVIKWLCELNVSRVIIENVREFLNWGALDETGRPIKELKGETFNAFIGVLKSLGYTVDWRLLSACDYGAPTTRKRLFIQAVKNNKKIIWAKQTHAKETWIPAKNIIDWNTPGKSIYNRKKPLSVNTLTRIEYGLSKYANASIKPFICEMRGLSKTRDINEPLSTITTSGSHHAIVEPFITQISQASVKDRSRPISEPLSTICTKNEHCLVEPFIKQKITDIHFRMLETHELAAAQSFPKNYKFTGTKTEIMKQIGNAVPPVFSYSLLKSILHLQDDNK